jgi:hypothetical protein
MKQSKKGSCIIQCIKNTHFKKNLQHNFNLKNFKLLWCILYLGSNKTSRLLLLKTHHVGAVHILSVSGLHRFHPMFYDIGFKTHKTIKKVPG